LLVGAYMPYGQLLLLYVSPYYCHGHANYGQDADHNRPFC